MVQSRSPGKLDRRGFRSTGPGIDPARARASADCLPGDHIAHAGAEVPSGMHATQGRVPESWQARGIGWRGQLIGIGVVTLVATGHAVHDLLQEPSGWRPVLSSAAIVGQCAALSLGHSLALRWNAPRRAVWTGGLLVSAAFGVLILVLHHGEGWHLSPPAVAMAALALSGTLLGVGIAGLWLLLFQLPRVVARARLHALEVESLRREAELSRLRVHLHPHFLLNTLNAIAGLVTEDAEEARGLIAALGDLVRDALADGEELQPFGVEVAWLRRYASILEARHRGFLAFRWGLEEATLAVHAPRLLLQPLVENAVKHGALRKRDGGSVLVRSETLDGGRVRFVVEDDGPGLGPNCQAGLGLSLVRRRLALLCPGGSLRFEPLEAGTRVVVELPNPGEGHA